MLALLVLIPASSLVTEVVAATPQDSVNLSPEARSVLDRAMKQYAETGHYSDAVHYEQVATLATGEVIRAVDDYGFFFDRERGFALRDWEGFSLFFDGSQLTTHGRFAGRFVRRSLRDTTRWREAVPEFVAQNLVLFHPVAVMFFDAIRRPEEFPGLVSARLAEETIRNGVPVIQLEAILDLSDARLLERQPTSLWFDRESGAFRGLTCDISWEWGERAESVIFDVWIERMSSDRPSDEDLAFVAGDIDLEVDNMFANPTQSLVGKPAPAFQAELLDGETLRSEDLAGSVVILEFWGTWCIGCAQSLAHIQEIYEHYADASDVRVLGVNMDGPDEADKVRTYLSARDLTFPQSRDFDSRISEAFRVRSTPTIVLIDRSGLIRTVAPRATLEGSRQAIEALRREGGK